MSGFTKHMYEKDVVEIERQLSAYVKQLSAILPLDYDFNSLVELIEEFYPMLEDRKLELKVNKPNTLIYNADGDKMARAFGNLLKNAVEAVKTQQVEKQIHLSCTENENEFCLGVRNRSEKIPLDEMGRFFEKGYSSKGSGRGLGLYNVKEICEKYGVDIVCDNTEVDDKNWFFIELHIKKSDETNLRNKSEKVSK